VLQALHTALATTATARNGCRAAAARPSLLSLLLLLLLLHAVPFYVTRHYTHKQATGVAAAAFSITAGYN
jgi:hypothetical protein